MTEKMGRRRGKGDRETGEEKRNYFFGSLYDVRWLAVRQRLKCKWLDLGNLSIAQLEWWHFLLLAAPVATRICAIICDSQSLSWWLLCRITTHSVCVRSFIPPLNEKESNCSFHRRSGSPNENYENGALVALNEVIHFLHGSTELNRRHWWRPSSQFIVQKRQCVYAKMLLCSIMCWWLCCLMPCMHTFVSLVILLVRRKGENGKEVNK